MNLIQMLCCSLIVKGGELGQQYLSSKSESIQNTLRVRTATDTNRFLDSLVQELTLSGKDACKCSDLEAAPATRILRGNRTTWHKRKI
jgi:hypothetical protein